jgi:hypothetical protein
MSYEEFNFYLDLVNFKDGPRELHVTYWKYLPCPPMPAAPNPVSAVLWSESESTTDPEKQQIILRHATKFC